MQQLQQQWALITSSRESSRPCLWLTRCLGQQCTAPAAAAVVVRQQGTAATASTAMVVTFGGEVAPSAQVCKCGSSIQVLSKGTVAHHLTIEQLACFLMLTSSSASS